MKQFLCAILVTFALLLEGDEIDVVVMDQKGKKVELATPEFLGLK